MNKKQSPLEMAVLAKPTQSVFVLDLNKVDEFFEKNDTTISNAQKNEMDSFIKKGIITFKEK